MPNETNTNASGDDPEPTTDRRTLLRAGGAGAATLGTMGYGAGSVGAATGSGDGASTAAGGGGGDGDGGGPAPGGGLAALLRRNEGWTGLLPESYFEDVRTSQSPEVVSVCCSDSRVSQEGMFLSPLEAGHLFKPSNIGNKVVTRVDGERVVDGSFLYALEELDVPTATVVGHTGCGAVTAAYDIATGGAADAPPGIAQEVKPIVGIVEEAFADGVVDPDGEEKRVVNQLVEYNVNAQIDFLRGSEEVPAGTELYGFVYDFQRAYGDVDGRTVLVNADGETDPDALRETVPEGYEAFVGSLLA